MRPPAKLYHVAPEDAHPLMRGTCLVEDAYPSLLFSAMYGAYDFMADEDWLRAFVIGGAYSADKWYRLERGLPWFTDEQLTDWERKEVTSMIADVKPRLILSHTCPFRYEPVDMFLPMIDQSTVDDSMERWLDTIETSVHYDRWLCGHWHTSRTVDKMRFLYHDILMLEDII